MHKRDGLLIILMAGLATVATPSMAQRKSELRTDAKDQAAQIRSVGEPKDRCTLDAGFGPSGAITAIYGSPTFSLGDKLLVINGTDVKGQGDKASEVLRGIAPGSTISVKVERAGTEVDLAPTCGNSREQNATILSALDAAARGDFDQCATLFGSREDLANYYAARWQRNCLTLAKKPSESEIADQTFTMLQLGVSEATWEPSMRQSVAVAVRDGERRIGPSRYQTLVAAAERWPGGEDIFKQSEPNFAQFRAAAERAIKPQLFDPDSARIEFPYVFTHGSYKPWFKKAIEGYWTCGRYNARNRLGGYTGSAWFLVVVSESGEVRHAELGTNDDFDVLSAQCRNAMEKVSLAPTEVSEPASSVTAPAQLSLGDEIKKLVELRDSGAITEEEFQAAKQKLLDSPASP